MVKRYRCHCGKFIRRVGDTSGCTCGRRFAYFPKTGSPAPEVRR